MKNEKNNYYDSFLGDVTPKSNPTAKDELFMTDISSLFIPLDLKYLIDNTHFFFNLKDEEFYPF